MSNAFNAFRVKHLPTINQFHKAQHTENEPFAVEMERASCTTKRLSWRHNQSTSRMHRELSWADGWKISVLLQEWQHICGPCFLGALKAKASSWSQEQLPILLHCHLGHLGFQSYAGPHSAFSPWGTTSRVPLIAQQIVYLGRRPGRFFWRQLWRIVWLILNCIHGMLPKSWSFLLFVGVVIPPIDRRVIYSSIISINRWVITMCIL